ncbi:universal stress protein [Kitasatospora sp. LaBMicrA B282]|uniref:universal stress protein n=1 Tax=Kitasatospora sp. LaBMicrA B282 TaxID=3420949 RepID=UPI003D129813
MTGNGDGDRAAQPPRVVVGVDGSESSRAALRWAVRHAGLIGGAVEAVGVIEVPQDFGWNAPVVDTSFDEDMTRRRFGAELRTVLGETPTVAVQELLVRGDPVDALVEAARGAELVVVGSRGHGRVARALLGSVSQQVAQQASCPVVIVRPD